MKQPTLTHPWSMTYSEPEFWELERKDHFAMFELQCCMPQTGVSTQISTDKRRRMGREEFLKRLSASCPHSTNVMSIEANRLQLLQFFKDQYLPTEQTYADAPPLMWLATFAYVGSSKALSKAVSAVSVSTIYRMTNDRRVLHAATKLYFGALKEARKELARPLEPATRVAISYILSFCELFHCTSVDDSSAQPHTYFAISVLESNRANSHEGILHHIASGIIRAFVTWGLLTWRKCPLELNICSSDLSVKEDCHFSTLIDLALVVSKVAEDSDTLCSLTTVACPSLLLQHLSAIRHLGKISKLATRSMQTCADSGILSNLRRQMLRLDDSLLCTVPATSILPR